MGRIGVIGDTHDDLVPWDGVHDRVARAFEGVELIVHCGDLTTMAVLDRLGEIAPVLAVRSTADPDPEPPRLLDGPRVLETDGLAIGVVNSLRGDLAQVFDRRVDVVLHGGTHAASIDTRDGVLCLNPGSPTLAEAVTVGVLDTDGGRPTATIVPL